MKFYIISLLVAIYLQKCHTARILGVFPYPSLSQHIVFRGVMEELAKQGHHIVVMTPNPVHYKDTQFKNITEIDVQNLSYDVWNKNFDRSKLKPNSIGTKYTYYAMYKSAIIHLVDAQLSSPQMKKLLNDKTEQFDLVFSQHLTPIMFPIADHFKAPLIVMTLSTGLLSTYDALGNPYHPVFYPDSLSPYDGKLNILQKVDVVSSNLWQRYNDWFFSSSSNAVALKHFGPKSLTIEEAENKMALLFTNNNPILAGIRPLVPAIIYLGGVHFKKDNKLSKELITILDKSQKGVIYVSLGNDVLSKDLSAEFISTFTDTLAELPYDVIWKWDNDTLLNKPPNVYVSKWVPQQDLLAHPKVRLFITQAGQLSMEEAIHYKVPMIGIPFILDQERNAKQLDKFNIGINLGAFDLDKDLLKTSILKVIGDKIYKERIEWFSDLLADQPETGLERAVWWTEYVLRHNGADHLRAPTMPLYEYLLLDIIAILIVGAVASIYASYTALRLLLEAFCKPKTGSKLKKS